jgi:hypothetical protein
MLPAIEQQLMMMMMMMTTTSNSHKPARFDTAEVAAVIGGWWNP